MTRGFSATIINSFLDTNFDDQYVQLHTGDPGSAGTANISVGSTTRVQSVTGAASAGSKTQSSNTGPWTNEGTTETLTDISLFSAASGGTFKVSGQLSSSQPWASGNTFTLTTLTISFTPLAA